MALSLRGARAAEPSDGLFMFEVMANIFDPESNPHGYVSLGIAENCLMHETFASHVAEKINLPLKALTYGDGPTGSKRLKTTMARFLTKHLHPVKKLEASHISIVNGCTSALEHIAWLFANPGDGILLGMPYYGTFINDLTARTGALVVPVAFGDVDPFDVSAIQQYETALIEARRIGQRVTALVLCHPHNPLGRCYPKATLVALMRLCEKYQIHLISDEIYALSVFGSLDGNNAEDAPFHSCLAINPEGIINPALVHVIWGFSKDFGSNGIRVGAIISPNNPQAIGAMTAVGLYSSVSSISDHVAANIMEDDAWTDAYIKENRRKLGDHYLLAKTWAEENGIEYSKGVTAAFFLWVNLGKYYASKHSGEISWATDETIMAALLEKRVFLAAGKQFGSERPGWFRLVFSNPKELLEEGLRRAIQALGQPPDAIPSR